jgi:Porin PorA
VKRKWFGMVLLGLGAFLLVVGVLATVWAPGVVKKTPLDVDQTTHLDGTVNKLNAETGELEENPVKVESISKADADASTDDVTVWVQSACVVIDTDDAPNCVDGDDPRLVSASTDVFASDRVSAEAIADFKGLPADAVPHEGLVNKWPFDSEKKDYTYWNGTLDKAIPAVYKGTESILGIETYIYEIKVENEPIQIADGIPGTYSDDTTIYVEPKTGAIQQQTDSMQQYLEDGTQVVDLDIGFTQAQQKAFADDAKTNMRMLAMMTLWMPIVGFVGGVLCLLAGVALLVTARRRDDAGSDRKELGGASG